jgi:hypothetical protein
LNYKNYKQYLTDIADAIRYVEESTDLIKAVDFKDRISNLKEKIEANPSKYSEWLIQYLSGAIKQITSMPNSGISIGPYAFYEYVNLEQVSMKAFMISQYAFAHCNALTTVTLESVDKNGIDATAFSDCNNLTSITIYSDGTFDNAPFGAVNATITYIKE